MKVIPFLLLSLLIVPESITIFPFGIANAHPIHAPALNETAAGIPLALAASTISLTGSVEK